MHIYKFPPKTNSHPNDDNSPQIPKKTLHFVKNNPTKRPEISIKTAKSLYKHNRTFHHPPLQHLLTEVKPLVTNVTNVTRHLCELLNHKKVI